MSQASNPLAHAASRTYMPRGPLHRSYLLVNSSMVQRSLRAYVITDEEEKDKMWRPGAGATSAVGHSGPECRLGLMVMSI